MGLRRRWLSAAGLVLGLIGASLATAGQAAAIPGLVPVSTTVPGFNLPVFAVAPCPAGKVVHGLGGEIIGGNGQVHLLSLEPNAALTSVKVGAAPTVPAVAPWQLTAYAICGFPTAMPHLEMSPAPGTADLEKCDNPSRLYGTGARHGGHPDWTLHEMAPSVGALPTSARARLSPAGGMPGVTAMAICGNPVPGLQSLAAPAAIGSTAVCPHGQRVHGTGGLIPSANPDIVFEGIVPNNALTQVRVTARNRTTLLQEPTVAFAVCA